MVGDDFPAVARFAQDVGGRYDGAVGKNFCCAGGAARHGRQPPDAGWQPSLGTLESPERGATLVLTVDALSDAAVTYTDSVLDLRLEGPGIPGTRMVSVTGLDPGWLAQRAAWVGAFPLGVDLVLAAPHALVALPRTTRIAIDPVKETV